MEWYLYTNGFATAYFLFYGVHLWRRKDARRFVRIISVTLVIWALLLLKDLWLVHPERYVGENLRAVAYLDGVCAVCFSLLLLELTRPGWITWRKLAWWISPFPLFVLLGLVHRGVTIHIAYMVFLILFSVITLAMAYRWANRYSRFVRENYSSLNDIDLSWMPLVFAFYVLLQLFWLYVTLRQSPWMDGVYNLASVFAWHVFIRKCLALQPLSQEELQEIVSECKKKDQDAPYNYPFAACFEKVMCEEELYLKKGLTVSELAVRFNTNRTYLNSYFTNVVQQTFYDYINGLRIELKALPLMCEHPEYTLDYVADVCGFTATSTFRRAFKKKMGYPPSQHAVS